MIEILNVAGQRTAYISAGADGLKDVTIDSRLNGECVLNFSLPFDSPKWAEITTECRIVAGGREFVVLRPDAVDIERDGQKKWGMVTAQESWILLSKQHPTVPSTGAPLTVNIPSTAAGQGGFLTGSAGSALFQILAGSGWSVGTVDVTGTHSLITEKLSLLGNIERVQEIWGGLLIWNSIARTVSLRPETWQNYTGFQVRYAKNLKHITRTTNNNLVTRLFPFGRDDLTIASVNAGVIHLTNTTFTPRIYTGIYQNQGISDATALRDRGNEILNRVSRPRHTFFINMVDLRTLPGYTHENFVLGDMVDVVDEELGINIRARLVRHKFDVFQPWKCELEIGEPEERLAAKLADSLAVADFVDNALRPNPSTANLLKGFVNTFTTQINSSNGRLIWSDNALQAIEIDGVGNPTGRRVRITPGGIGVSTDGGQTFSTAMTGAGILANRIIVSELFALSTEDGHTRLTGSGLEVWDNRTPRRKRLHAGQYATGRFGLELRDSTGNIVLIDDEGILQTWQEGAADNVASGHPLILNVFLPVETRSVRRALLRFRLMAFRAHATGASSGGGISTTTADGGGAALTSGAGGAVATTTAAGGGVTTTTAAGGGVTSMDGVWVLDTTVMLLADFMQHQGGHNHGIANNTALALAGGGSVTFVAVGHHAHGIFGRHNHSLPTHTHDITLANHSHSLTLTDHSHSVSVPTHSHSVSAPAHEHALIFGIFTSTAATGVTVVINGVDRTASLGGPFNVDQASLNIAPFLTVGQWNTIALGSSQLGRIDATVFIQAMMGV